MPSVCPSLVLFAARLSGLAVALLVLYWALAFKSTFLPSSLSQQDFIYAVLHPLLMVIGFILLSGEAILVHRWLPGSMGLKKLVHLVLQGVALASGIFGIWTRFQGKDGIVANFYSLHSWMGLICISLFGTQASRAIHLHINPLLSHSSRLRRRACHRRHIFLPRILRLGTPFEVLWTIVKGPDLNISAVCGDLILEGQEA
ncbi:hypothetical protein PIB30_093533 [Stylosanthes scabra]|uniref:Cytochrome b561 domain-containing protein n=1 Tax=Stylosanthes scabra TaxID=79078 RepID=A0ABU6SXI5_9FABA|nr:hypothetical protein [Stylosanthes scabra]